MIVGDEHANVDNDDLIMEKLTIKWLINFVKTGNPTSSDFKWEPTTRRNPLKYAEFLPTPQLKDSYLLDRVKFWTRLTQEYDYDLVRMRPKKQGDIIHH